MVPSLILGKESTILDRRFALKHSQEDRECDEDDDELDVFGNAFFEPLNLEKISLKHPKEWKVEQEKKLEQEQRAEQQQRMEQQRRVEEQYRMARQQSLMQQQTIVQQRAVVQRMVRRSERLRAATSRSP